jgi:RNase P subunit RPR2
VEHVLGDDEYDEYGDEFDDEPIPLDEQESALVKQDLVDLESFEATFAAEGYRGVSVYCQDCAEEHYYPWDLLRGNLQLLLETGETPVHEPAFAPDPDQYVPWEYARGYVDALTDVGVDQRRPVGDCPRCKLELPVELVHANFCPRCSMPLLGPRLATALLDRGFDEAEVGAILREMGLPG